MKRTVAMLFISIMVFAVVFAGSCGAESFVAASPASAPKVITDKSAFFEAVNKAKDGDTIYVGDIDFTVDEGLNPALRMTVSKSVVIRNGKSDCNAIFSGFSLILNGTKVSGDKMTFVMDGIDFDGGIDGLTLTKEDWLLPQNSQGEYTSTEPVKAQYAVTFFGNVNAIFNNCNFTRYMYDYGGAIWCRYGDYTQDADLQRLYGDNRSCRLDLSLNNCNFTGNSGYYAGGAIYLDGNGNVSLTAKNCNFNNNICTLGNYCEGGGAVYAYMAALHFEDCAFSDNTANHPYDGERFDGTDSTGGGAIKVYGSVEGQPTVLNMENCVLTGNRASMGGAVCIFNSTVTIDGCIIAENRAEPYVVDARSEWGVSSNMGMGGGVYVNNPIVVALKNTSVYSNFAKNVGAGVYSFYTPGLENMPQWIGRLDIAMCTFAENDCDTTEYEYSDTPAWIWFTYPGNFWDIPYINAFGNFVIDSLFADTFEKYETPSADNGYNYFASHTAAAEDGFVMPEFTDGKYCHITAEDMNKDNLTIPEDAVSTNAEEYDFYIGTPIVGSNYVSEVTVRLYVTKRKYQEMTVSYGDTLQLPTPTRTGYSFLYWQTADGIEFGGGNVLFSAGTTELYLYAQYDNLFLAPLLYSLLGVAVLSSAVVAVAFTVKRRRAAVLLAAVNEFVAVDDELGSPKADTSMLTSREKEVLELLLEGKQRKEIASILFLSENTIKKQITSIYQKLSVSSRSELFALFR